MKRENYISDEAVVKRAKEAVRIELEKLKAMDIPVVIYDMCLLVRMVQGRAHL